MLKEIASYVHLAVSRLAWMNKPLMTAINGPSAGAGLSRAVPGDIALAAESYCICAALIACIMAKAGEIISRRLGGFVTTTA
jgi:2-(1,2-epoxy-1,2-dihydrophenyl)acetyl-CoA isomerase